MPELTKDELEAQKSQSMDNAPHNSAKSNSPQDKTGTNKSTTADSRANKPLFGSGYQIKHTGDIENMKNNPSYGANKSTTADSRLNKPKPIFNQPPKPTEGRDDESAESSSIFLKKHDPDDYQAEQSHDRQMNNTLQANQSDLNSSYLSGKAKDESKPPSFNNVNDSLNYLHNTNQSETDQSEMNQPKPIQPRLDTTPNLPKMLEQQEPFMNYMKGRQKH